MAIRHEPVPVGGARPQNILMGESICGNYCPARPWRLRFCQPARSPPRQAETLLLLHGQGAPDPRLLQQDHQVDPVLVDFHALQGAGRDDRGTDWTDTRLSLHQSMRADCVIERRHPGDSHSEGIVSGNLHPRPARRIALAPAILRLDDPLDIVDVDLDALPFQIHIGLNDLLDERHNVRLMVQRKEDGNRPVQADQAQQAFAEAGRLPHRYRAQTDGARTDRAGSAFRSAA